MNRIHLRPLARVLAVAGLALPLAAQEPSDAKWDTTLARGATREIAFTATEGTWMSADLSPDGQWIVFDLLAHVYKMPAAGGAAVSLTQGSGVAINFHPRWSPDGKTIAFVSDRRGQNNLWVMDANGGNARQVFHDLTIRVFEPAWSPDGQYIAVRRQSVGETPSAGIWMYHKDGGTGFEVVGRDARGAAWPAFSPDGAHLYFHRGVGQAPVSGRADILAGAFQIHRVTLDGGKVDEITAGSAQQQGRNSNGGAIAPEISPDGRWMAFARRNPDGVITYKGQSFGPRTALWLRDLQTGAERVLIDPIEMDMAEGMKTWRVLPGYDWAADSQSLIVSIGGRLHRVSIAGAPAVPLPMSAPVRRTISEMAYRPFRIEETPVRVKFTRWPTASPDGKTLVFEAVGKLWLMDLPAGTPRRLTPADFTPTEASPSWSPDGQAIAFATWDDTARGHVWRVARTGGSPQRLSADAGEFMHPVWTPDGQQIVAARGSGETLRGRELSDNFWWDLVRLPGTGGAATVITRVDTSDGTGRGAVPRVSLTRDGRLFFHEEAPPPAAAAQGPGGAESSVELKSIALDGRDERIHLRFPYADETAVSPDGRWVAFNEGDNIFVTALPPGTGRDVVRLTKRRGQLPVDTLSRDGGLFPRFRADGQVEFGNGATYIRWNPETKASERVSIALEVPRAVPDTSFAFVNARILTMEKRQVIERGTVVVKGARIACVGTCSTAGIGRVIDARGKTILPGFIDMHAHHHREYAGVTPKRAWENLIYLAYGVTTTLDNSMWSQNVFPTAEQIESGFAEGPRTFSTGDPLYRGDGGRQNEITSYDVAEQNVARLQSWGAVMIKQYLQPRRDPRQWISDIARKRGLMVTSEGDSLEYNLSMIMDGQTAWEHPLSYAPLYADATTFFGMARAVYSPTFIVGGGGPWNEEYFWQETELWKDAKAQKWLPWQQLVPHTRRRIVRPVTDYSFPMIAQALQDIVDKGGFGAIGSHGQQHAIGSHWEIWMAASAMGAMGALEVATVHGAHFLGASADLGTLAAGKLADLLILNNNPLVNIRHTQDIQYVMKGGVLYDAMTVERITGALP